MTILHLGSSVDSQTAQFTRYYKLNNPFFRGLHSLFVGTIPLAMAWPAMLGISLFYADYSAAREEQPTSADSSSCPSSLSSLDGSLQSYLERELQPWVQARWHPLETSGSLVCMEFQVRRDGQISHCKVVKSSGDFFADGAALAALSGLAPPLPNGAPEIIDVVFNFEFGDAKSSNKSTLGNLSGTPYKDFTDYSKVLGRRAVQAPAVREEQFKNALNQAKMNKTTSASSLISAYLEYADYEYSIGHYASAAKLLTEVESSNTLESSRLDRKHQVKLAHCCDNIGLRKQALSRYTAIFEEALALEGINAESSTNSQLAIARRSLVEHCARFGRVKEAKKLIQDAITSFESIRPVVCLSQRVEAERYFAALYNRLKLHNAEQKHLLKALSLIETKFDSLTPESLEVRSDLAASYISAGNRTSAISLYRDMVDSYEHKDSDDYANSLSHLAVFYCEQKMLSEAEKAIRKALQLRDSIYGANDERLVTARFSLLEILEAQGRLAEAIEEAD